MDDDNSKVNYKIVSSILVEANVFRMRGSKPYKCHQSGKKESLDPCGVVQCDPLFPLPLSER